MVPLYWKQLQIRVGPRPNCQHGGADENEYGHVDKGEQANSLHFGTKSSKYGYSEETQIENHTV